MGGQYGSSRAASLLQQGKYEEAVAAATEDFAHEAANPEHLFDRANGLVVLGRFEEAAADLERAVELDEEASVLDGDAVDDAYFSALLGAAKQAAHKSTDDAVHTLERYRRRFPLGSHDRDVIDWSKRLRGEQRTEWTKERE